MLSSIPSTSSDFGDCSWNNFPTVSCLVGNDKASCTCTSLRVPSHAQSPKVPSQHGFYTFLPYWCYSFARSNSISIGICTKIRFLYPIKTYEPPRDCVKKPAISGTACPSGLRSGRLRFTYAEIGGRQKPSVAVPKVGIWRKQIQGIPRTSCFGSKCWSMLNLNGCKWFPSGL
jgi:hypothetical protein